MYKAFWALLCCAMLFVIFPVSANGDEWNKRTVVTFSAPVELPGIVLPAGTYVFKLADSMSDRHIVQVFNAEENHIYATILAIPDYRLTPKEKTVMSLEERPINTPEALRAWFYPGDNFGQEFVYPKARAKELAEITKVPVLSAEVTPMEQPEELLKAPVVAETPDRREVEIAELMTIPPIQPREVVPIEPVEPAAPVETAAPIAELPKTASPLPLTGMLGFAALGFAGLLKAISKRS